jgi:hypothetical protein
MDCVETRREITDFFVIRHELHEFKRIFVKICVIFGELQQKTPSQMRRRYILVKKLSNQYLEYSIF